MFYWQLVTDWTLLKIIRVFREAKKSERSRGIRTIDTVTYLVKLLSLEFPWLGANISRGSHCALTNTSARIKYMSRHNHSHTHSPTMFLMQFTEPCPIMARSYRIGKNTGFSANTWSEPSGGEKILVSLSVDTSLLHSQTWLVICWPVVPSPIAADCSKKCSPVRQRVLCWLQMWFGLECKIGWTQIHYSWNHAELMLKSHLATEKLSHAFVWRHWGHLGLVVKNWAGIWQRMSDTVSNCSE